MAQIGPNPNTGTITVTGDDSNSDFFVTYGTIQVSSGGHLTINSDSDGSYLTNGGGTITNDGTLTNNSGLFNYYSGQDFSSAKSGTFTNNGTLYNNDRLQNENSTFTNNGTFTNNRLFTNFSNYSNGTFTNNGTLTNNGNIRNDINSAFTNSIEGTFTNNGIFDNGGGPFTNNGTLAGTGTFRGSALSGGTVSPGNISDPDATFTVETGFNLGTLKTTFSGTDGGDYDLLQVNGAANLVSGGKLEFSFDEAGLKNDIAEGQTESITFLQSTGLTNSLDLATFTPTDDEDNGADFDFALKQSGNNLVLDITRLTSNTAPTATNDEVSTSKGTAVTVELSDNVADAQGLTESTLKTTDVVNGTVAIDSDAQQITFAPNSDFVGTTSFNYTITDTGGLASNAATITVNVGDVISTGNQSQNITGNEGNDVVSAGNGKDTISGLGGADVLAGNNGVDTINGGDGNDKITGGNGADLLTGGSGSDQFVLAKGAGTDTITDFVAGTDKIALAGGITFDSLSLSGNNIILTSSNETLASLTGVDTSTLTAANFVTA